MKAEATTESSVDASARGPWDAALPQLREWDPIWAETCVKMSTGPWTNGVLTRKFIELVSLGLNAACTNLNADGTRRHIRAALDAGASREEILFVLKCASIMAIHALTAANGVCEIASDVQACSRLVATASAD